MKPVRTAGDPGGGLAPSRVLWIMVAGMVLLIVLGVVARKHPSESDNSNGVPSLAQRRGTARADSDPRLGVIAAQPASETDVRPTAQEIVATKLANFGRKRLAVVQAMARQRKVQVPDEVERFFEAVENGRWEEIDAAHQALLLNDKELNQPRSADLHEIWRPIQEVWGVAREAHDWPAQRLLDYGNSILDSLRPGMIYAGGTDPGCFIPTMLNETSDGESHIVLTQNALADGTYLHYLNFLYGDRMTTLSDEDSQRAFQEYVTDAQRRLEHDQQFPNEPAQLKPGEDVKLVDGRVQVSGQVAVMAINEKLFQTLMANNPNASFAMEESFPFQSMYGNATPLGPIMEMGVQDQQNGLTAERAAQSIDFWRSTAEQLLSDPEVAENSDPRKAYSKLISSQAGLLADHQFTTEAEQAFGIAAELYPGSPEVTFRYVNLLLSQHRVAEALQVTDSALKADPNFAQFHDLHDRLAALSTAPGH